MVDVTVSEPGRVFDINNQNFPGPSPFDIDVQHMYNPTIIYHFPQFHAFESFDKYSNIEICWKTSGCCSENIIFYCYIYFKL